MCVQHKFPEFVITFCEDLGIVVVDLYLLAINLRDYKLWAINLPLTSTDQLLAIELSLLIPFSTLRKPVGGENHIP